MLRLLVSCSWLNQFSDQTVGHGLTSPWLKWLIFVIQVAKITTSLGGKFKEYQVLLRSHGGW